MASMDLNTLASDLRAQAQAKAKIVLDASVFADTAIREAIRSAFALTTGEDFTITKIQAADIKDPVDGRLTIAAGSTSVLKQNDVSVSLTFLSSGSDFQAIIVTEMAPAWKLNDSFAGLDRFPFKVLTTSGARFVYATAQQRQFPWPGEEATKIDLAPGLNFLSNVTITQLTTLCNLVKSLGKDVSATLKLHGPLAPTKGQALPVGKLSAPLGLRPLVIGDSRIGLELSAPSLAVEIGTDTVDSPNQPIDLMVEAQLQEMRVAVGIPVTGGGLEVSTQPLSPRTSIDDLIKKLPGGEDFRQFIPSELSSVFSEVGLDNFSLMISSEPRVTYVGLSISTRNSWPIPGGLVLKELRLEVETIEPSGLNLTQVHISATASFLKDIFGEDFAFTVELEKPNLTSWEVKTITGAYTGTVNLGKIVDHILRREGSVPSALKGIEFSDFGVAVNREAQGFTYRLYGRAEAAFPILGTEFSSTLNLAITKTSARTQVQLGGDFVIGEQSFSLNLDLGTPDSKLTATWQNQGTPFGFGELASALGWKMPKLPEELDLKLTGAEFTYDFSTVMLTARSASQGQIVFASLKKNNSRVYVCSLDIPINLKFTQLPLVGDSLRTDKPVGVDKLQIDVASAALSEQDVTTLNKLITERPDNKPLIPKSLGEGLTLAANLEMNGAHEVILPLTAAAKREESQLLSAPTALSAGNYKAEPKWIELNKTFGPVRFDKVGVQYEASTLRFLLNAALSAAGLTLSVEGLSVGSSLKKFKPEFELRGLGIDYRNDAVEIGGAFVRTITDGKADSYNGAAVIKTKQFALSALGSYTTLDGEPSLFIYAFLDYPLGGPAFFFVTGLAAGFGYNRRLIAPSVEKVADFPLVKQAVGGRATKPKDVMDALTSLQAHVPPNVGSIFLAIGVKFNSFKLVDSFALLTIEFGNNLAINLIGLSKAVVPTPETGKAVTPLAQVEIAWKATFNPDDGCLGIDARLTSNSYILSKDCHLSGGYAFYSWFSGPHAGDFVQTLGGYHPKFNVPDHYPKVPRLAFDWRVSNSLTIQGDAYYALTGSALMAGGHLEVLFRDGGLRAWLKLGADFLIAWKPYHYDASIYVNVGASYTFDINLLFTRVRVTISVDVGAQLHLWGPDFSGTARIDLSVISFTIAFGAGASQAPKPLETWKEFQESFLPLEKDVCTISVKSGLVRNIQAKGTEPERWVINPKQFSLVIDSAIPLKSVDLLGGKLKEANTDFGIAPMAVTKQKQTPPPPTPKQKQFTDSNLQIDITRRNSGRVSDTHFKYSLVKKLVPAGLWGESATPSLNGDKFLENVATGIEITPGKSPASGETKKLDVDVFTFKDEAHEDAFKWELASSFKVEKKEPDDRRITIAKTAGSNPKRDALKAELGMKFDISIGRDFAGDFVTAPQIGTLELCQPK